MRFYAKLLAIVAIAASFQFYVFANVGFTREAWFTFRCQVEAISGDPEMRARLVEEAYQGLDYTPPVAMTLAADPR